MIIRGVGRGGGLRGLQPPNQKKREERGEEERKKEEREKRNQKRKEVEPVICGHKPLAAPRPPAAPGPPTVTASAFRASPQPPPFAKSCLRP